MPLSTIDYTAGQDNLTQVFDKTNAIVTAVNEFHGGTTDQVFKKTNSTDFNVEPVNSILPDTGTPNLKIKVLEIGDWDMDTLTLCDVAHGISDYTKIRKVEAIIRNDANTELTPLIYMVHGLGTPTSFGGLIRSITGINIRLERISNTHAALLFPDPSIFGIDPGTGLFDNTDYDSTSFNRGWITITYEG
jgi:hypothetical protein